MKFVISALVILSAASAFAGETCGTLGAHTVGPVCKPGQMCPMYLRIQYDLTAPNGSRYDLETGDHAVLENFEELKGRNVCVSGTDTSDQIEVSAISAE